MATKQHNRLVIALAAVIAIAILFLQWRNNHRRASIESRVYKVANGWGYDILVNDTIVIHQASIPVLPDQKPFATSEQADRAARTVITKLKDGRPPTLTTFDLEKILPVHEMENGP